MHVAGSKHYTFALPLSYFPHVNFIAGSTLANLVGFEPTTSDHKAGAPPVELQI